MATIRIPLAIQTGDASGNTYPTRYDASPHIYVVPAFAKDVAGYWYGVMRVPLDYSSTPKIIMAIGANATSGVSRLAVSSYAIADTESYDSTYTTETAQDITVPATAYLRKDVTFSLTSTIAAGDDLIFRLDHEGAHVNDTLAVDTLLFNAVFEYATA